MALMMAIEARKVKYSGGILDNADEYYDWLQNAPQKDSDHSQWFDGSTITKPLKSKDK